MPTPAPRQWHLTLEFLGEVEAGRFAALHAAATRVAVSPPLEIILDRLEYCPRPQVLCLASTAAPPAAQSFVQALRSALPSRDPTPQRRPWQPHLTLARKARQPVSSRPVEPLHWPAGEFVLVRSVTDPAGSRYEPLMRWNLRPDTEPAGGG